MRILLTKRLLVKNILGVIYEMAPGCRPRNIDKIYQYILEYCNKNIIDYETEVDSSNINKYIKDILMDCNEFTQLNISQKLWDKGIRDYKDENNSGFSATFVEHDVNGEVTNISNIEEYNDFIDLIACIDAICRDIIIEKQQKEDCFLCKFAGKYGNMKPTDCEECKTCIINPNYTFNRILHPKALLPINSEEYKNYKE